MQPRRPLALVAAALLLCVPMLSSCGFNRITDRPYTQAAGINYRVGPVFVLNAVIAAAQPDSGTLIASLTNQTDTKTATLDSIAGAGGTAVTAADFSPIPIVPMGLANLADTRTVTLSGSFAAGDVIPLTLNFADGSTIEMDVPVVYACQEYAGLDSSQPAASSADPSASTDPSVPASPSSSDAAAASSTTSPSSTASPSGYTCGTTGSTGGRS